MAVVRRVGVFSLAKVLGVLYAAFGLLAGAFVSLFAIVGSALTSGLEEEGAAAAAIGLFLGVGAIVVFPIVYGLLGFVGGAITAFLYNLIAGVVGGVDLDLG